jgi:hypothetical protein
MKDWFDECAQRGLLKRLAQKELEVWEIWLGTAPSHWQIYGL